MWSNYLICNQSCIFLELEKIRELLGRTLQFFAKTITINLRCSMTNFIFWISVGFFPVFMGIAHPNFRKTGGICLATCAKPGFASDTLQQSIVTSQAFRSCHNWKTFPYLDNGRYSNLAPIAAHSHALPIQLFPLENWQFNSKSTTQ